MVVSSGAVLAKSPELLSQLFAEARKRAPCILFIDEFDVCAGKARVQGVMVLERQKILNLLLVELDGFDPLEGVVIVGATHNGEEIDPAVLRPGRLGRQLMFCYPGFEERKQVWASHIKGGPVSDFDLDALAGASRSFSNASIAEACERAKWNAALDGAEAIDTERALRARDEIYWGEASGGMLSEEAKWSLSAHEAGHALVALDLGFHPLRATVRPRADFAGAVQVVGEEGTLGMGLETLENRLAVTMAGFAAERLLTGRVEDGALSDFAKARSLIQRALLDTGVAEGKPRAYMTDVMGGPNLSQRALEAFEAKAQSMVEGALALAGARLSERRDGLERLARELMERKEMSEREMREVLGW